MVSFFASIHKTNAELRIVGIRKIHLYYQNTYCLTPLPSFFASSLVQALAHTSHAYKKSDIYLNFEL